MSAQSDGASHVHGHILKVTDKIKINDWKSDGLIFCYLKLVWLLVRVLLNETPSMRLLIFASIAHKER